MTENVPLGWLYLPVAFALGALHALEPGHGKSLASAYLITGEHDWKDAIALGLATTFSHTAVVVLLALGSLALKSYFAQGDLEHGVALAGAGILIVMGAWVAFNSVQDLRHGHSHSHSHSHATGERREGFWGAILLGLSNGVLPCPGALAALLVALSLGQLTLGLITVLTYSLGLAAALVAMGIVVVEAGRRVRSWLPSDRAMLWLPLVSGLLILTTGLCLLRGTWR
jgi:ABC-type nickel/cobalt efflux system permease component RcnA